MKEIIKHINGVAGRVVTVTGLTETTMTRDNVLGVLNGTQNEVLYVPMFYGDLQSVTYYNGTLTITLADTVPAIHDGDKLFVKLYADVEMATEAGATANKEAIIAAMPTIPTDYAKAGIGTNVTNTDLKTLLNAISTSMYKGVPIASQTGSATIQPNTWNIWSTDPSAAFTITKGTDIADITNVYMARFTLDANWASGAQVTFSGWNSLDWNGGAPTWTAGYTYEINIVNNIAMWAEISSSV